MSEPPERNKLTGAGFKKKRLLSEADTTRIAGMLSKRLMLNFSESDSEGDDTDIHTDDDDHHFASTFVCVQASASKADCEEASTSTILHDQVSVYEQSDSDFRDNDDGVNSPKSPLPSTPESEPTAAILDVSEPADWPPVICSSLREIIVLNGPAKPRTNFLFPKDASNRRFTAVHYRRRFKNGEKAHRNWLVYSSKLNRIFCFCCKLFTKLDMSLTSGGYNDWKNTSQNLSIHEMSKSHIAAMLAWNESLVSLGAGKSIGPVYQTLLVTETKHWQNVLLRLAAIVLYLGQQCLTFGDGHYASYSNSDNYLHLVEMLSKFDSSMQEHLRKIQNKEMHNYYLGKGIQNELVGLIAKEISKRLQQLLKDAKYYSIIFDCTTNSALVEQLTATIRFVAIKHGDSLYEDPEVTIEERFLGFIPLRRSTGEGMTEAVLSELKKLEIPLSDMRGQCYDFRSDIKAKHSGVQKKILDLNSRALCVPCSAHSLNVVVSDAVMTGWDAAIYFGVMQKIYAFISGSKNRWDVLKKHVSELTAKPLPDTRWASRIDAVRIFRFHIGDINETLLEIADDWTFAAASRSEAASLAEEIYNFKFLCFIVIWFNILQCINAASELLQSQTRCLPEVIDLLKERKQFLVGYRSDEGFEKVLNEARQLASEIEIDPVFTEVTVGHQMKRKAQFFNHRYTDLTEDPEEQFKLGVFYMVLDVAIKTVSERFRQIQLHSSYFQFLYNIEKLNGMPNQDLRKRCMDLQHLLTDVNSKVSDLDGVQLCEELTILAPIVKPKMMPIEVLAYVARIGFAPNVAIALRILLTLPITVAPGGKSLSKLKSIKNYLHSSMAQEQVLGLAMIAIENHIAQEIDIRTLVQDFAHAIAKTMPLGES
ncbi:hypothetical protein NDU88_007996 [Pleurodeles waltl]|uniref:TTF-type domain-containing protein n=1 Tax=Pleurodeles waltl TaxID=8319 RepID=A0AAV7PNH9_PLEWA|nr:hypothetical protein NDU88_007996 [Pleurodeles waltl]